MRSIVTSLLIFASVAVSSAENRGDISIPASTAGRSARDDGPQVRLLAVKTDITTRLRRMLPAIPLPPFSTWRRWLEEHSDAVHCALEWRTESGEWHYAELRSTRFMANKQSERVGWGELPIGKEVYGVYINDGRFPRELDHLGRRIEVMLDEPVACDYRQLEHEIRSYAARDTGRESGQPGDGSINRRLGGPAFTFLQNSNTMVNYVLRRCGVQRQAPANAVGWDTIPHFPHSTNLDTFEYDCTP